MPSFAMLRYPKWSGHRSAAAAVLLVLSIVPALAAQSPTGPSGAGGAKSTEPIPPFTAQLAAARQQLQQRSPELTAALNTAAEKLKALEKQMQGNQSPELLANYDDLVRRREALRSELAQLQELVDVYQGAIDAYTRTASDRKELEDLRAAQPGLSREFRSGDVPTFEAKLQQQRSVQRQQRDQEADRARRLTEIEAELKTADAEELDKLERERMVLLARQETQAVRREATEARLALLQAELEVARQLPEAPASRPATASAPSTEVAALAARVKQELADELALDARGRLAEARQQKAKVQRQIQEARRNGEDLARLQESLQYWTESEDQETRALRLSGLQKQEAQLQQQLVEMEARIQLANSTTDAARNTLAELTPQQRQKFANQYRASATDLRKDADRLEADAQRRFGWLGPVEETLLAVNASQKSLEDQLKGDVAFEDYDRLYTHYQRMKRIFSFERQQVNQTATVQTVIYYQNLRLATLMRRLASAYERTAEVLVPTQPTFFERYRKLFRALGVFAVMLGATYATKLVVWIAELIARWIKSIWPNSAFSVKRVSTLATFTASIVRLFIWIFGVITILYEFGIDPATSTGAIGLVGLIMAGMFQQIVVDFIKGLDIIAGRHYNVGDFVEVDSKHGHVIDFSVKYTRIRTFSGQELNIPNSRCIPSRRFPEGFVDNYVDIVLSEGADVNEAKGAIARAGMYVARQLEAVKERPSFVERFRTVGGRPVLRYHVRVLPGCDWVIADYYVPAVKAALEAKDIGIEGEPKHFFINRIDTFRKLFSRRLSEEEILQEAAEADLPTVSRRPEPEELEAGKKALPPEEKV